MEGTTIEHKRISIAMCTLNGARFLKEQIDSFLAQRRLPDELIVCDDGSTDGTIEIVQDYISRSPFPIHLQSNCNRLGPTKNFEKSIKLTSGEIVVLSDQDDVWHPEKLSRIEKAFSDSPSIGAVFSDASVVDENLQPLGYNMWQRVKFTRREQRLVAQGEALRVILRHYIATGATMALLGEFKPLILPIPSTWFHDAWIILIIACVARIDIIPEPLIRYRQHSANLIGGIKKSLLEEFAIARRTNRIEYYRDEIGRLLEACDRVMLFSLSLRPESKELALKLRHLLNRAKMPNRRILRLPFIVRELVSLRYSRFSRNWRSIAMDNFLP